MAEGGLSSSPILREANILAGHYDEGGSSSPHIPNTATKKHNLTTSDTELEDTSKKQRLLPTEEKILAGHYDEEIGIDKNTDVEPDMSFNVQPNEVRINEHFQGFPPEMQFGEDLCSIIIGTDAKMKLLSYINNAIAIQEKELGMQRTIQFDTCLREQDTAPTKNKDTYGICVQDPRLVDEELVKHFQDEYTQFKRSLNMSLSKFEVEDLRQKTDTYNEYEKFTKLRKELTLLYKNGQNIVQQLRILNKTGNLNFITCETSIIPLGLPRALCHELQDKIDHTVQEQNIQVLHTLIKQQLKTQKEVEDFMKELNEFVIAKAYRTVTLTHKNLSDGAIRYKEQNERKREGTNKEVRFAKEDMKEAPKERHRREETYEYRDKEAEKYRTYQRSHESGRQRETRRHRYRDTDSDNERPHYKKTYYSSKSTYTSDSDDDGGYYHHRIRGEHPKESSPYGMRVREGFREPQNRYKHHKDDTQRVTRAPREELRDYDRPNRNESTYHRYSDLDIIDSEDEPNKITNQETVNFTAGHGMIDQNMII